MKLKFIIPPLTGLLIASCSQTEEVECPDSSTSTSEYFRPLDKAVSLAKEAIGATASSTRTSEPTLQSIETLLPSQTGYTGSNASDPAFYLLNYANNEGFALISTDTRRPALYAFSDSGNLHISDTVGNPALTDYLKAVNLPYEEGSNINIPLDSLNYEFNPKLPPITTRYFDDGYLSLEVKPLFTGNIQDWSQSALNKFVKEGRYDTTPVGCVALAVGQIMAYYRQPYQWPVNQDEYDNATERYLFDWEVLQYRTVHDDIARFMEILGRPQYLNMSYGEWESAASLSLYHAKKTFGSLGYEDNIIESKFDFSKAAKLLHYKQPLLMKSHRPKGYGHAFTIDGYIRWFSARMEPDGSTRPDRYYFHFVWGNWGATNGYYLYDPELKIFNQKPTFISGHEGSSGGFEEEYNKYYMFYNFTPKQ